MLDLRATIIAAVSAFFVGVLSAWWITADYKEAKYTGVIAKMQLDAAAAVREAMQKAVAAERENNRIAQELEVANHEFRKSLEQAASDNRRLVDELGGLYDRQSAAGSGGLPAASAAASEPAGAAARTKLSDSLASLLLSESRRADEAAAYAKTCYQWVKELETLRK